MINLAAAVDNDVFLQFKHGIYLIASQGGRLLPIVTGEQNNPGPPMIVDHLEGRLREDKGSFVLSYLSPIDRQSQIDYVIDPENVAGCWMTRKIQVVSAITAP